MILNQTDEVAPSPPRRRFGLLRIFLASVLAGALVIASLTVHTPLLTLHPGPTPEVTSMIEVDGRTFDSAGTIHMTTVTLHPATFADALRGWISAEIAVIPRSYIYPPDLTAEEADERIAAQMSQSQYAAMVAALRELGFGLEREGALVRATIKGTPAAEQLRPGDVIVGIGNEPVRGPSDVSRALEETLPGGEVLLEVQREEGVEQLRLLAVEGADPGGPPTIGVELLQNYRLPFPIKIQAGSIGGPSAGLMFAVAIVDLLDVDDLTGGRVIAGTGEIGADGSIRAVGGVVQKVVAVERIPAQVFLVPSDEANDATRAARSSMKVVGVGSLHEAIAALRKG